MSFFSDIKQKVIEKKLEMDDKREFLQLVDEKTRPIKRAAYMKQMFKEAVNEGMEKAKQDAAKKLPKEKPKESDFGLGAGLEDPFKYLNKGKIK